MSNQSGNKTAKRDDPYASFRFKIEAKGITGGHFFSASGLSVSTEVVEHQEGGRNDYTHKLHGQTKYQNLVLKRGVTTDKSFFNWIKQSIKTPKEKVNLTVYLYGDKGGIDGVKEVVHQWNLYKAWPCKWEGGSFDTNSSAALVETLEIAYDWMEQTK